jgi:hypothetical protein
MLTIIIVVPAYRLLLQLESVASIWEMVFFAFYFIFFFPFFPFWVFLVCPSLSSNPFSFALGRPEVLSCSSRLGWTCHPGGGARSPFANHLVVVVVIAFRSRLSLFSTLRFCPHH